MNLLFSTGRQADETFANQGHKFLGAGELNGEEIHVFEKREIVPVNFNKPLVITNGTEASKDMYEITVLTTDSYVVNGYKNLIYLKNKVYAKSDLISHVNELGESSDGEFTFGNVAESAIDQQVSLLMELLADLDGCKGSTWFDVIYDESSIHGIMQQPTGSWEREELKLGLIGFLMDHPTIELRRKT